MLEYLLIATVAVQLVVLIVVVSVVVRGLERKFSTAMTRLLETAAQTSDRNLRDEFVRNRTEASTAASAAREELVRAVTKGVESAAQSLDGFARTETSRLEAFEQRLGRQAEKSERILGELRKTNFDQLEQLQAEASREAKLARDELVTWLKEIRDVLGGMLGDIRTDQQVVRQDVLASFGQVTEQLSNGLHAHDFTIQTNLTAVREDALRGLEIVQNEGSRFLADFRDRLDERLAMMVQTLVSMTSTNDKRMHELGESIDQDLQSLQRDNVAQLERMRQTVDEKLQGTLEKRIAESFRQVSERLELVHRGLGEMQSLANGLGDLQKTLSTPKRRVRREPDLGPSDGTT